MSSDSGSEQLDYDLQIDSPRKNIKQHGDKPGKPKEGGSSKSKEDGVSKPTEGEMSKPKEGISDKCT